MKKNIHRRLGLLALVFFGCRTHHPSSPVLPSSADAIPAYGDAYVDSSIGDASYLNPILASDSASADIVGLVYNGLVKYDKNIQLIGDLAESWKVSSDGLVITFHLRKNVRWHDGQPFTAND